MLRKASERGRNIYLGVDILEEVLLGIYSVWEIGKRRLNVGFNPVQKLPAYEF